MTGVTPETPDVPEPPALEEKPGPSWRDRGRALAGHLTELPVLILAAFVIAVVIKTLLVQAFFIPSGSMLPTLHPGDRVLVEKLAYRLHDPRRGDVVVFEKSVFGVAPDVPWYQDAKNFIRELLGLPTGDEEDYIKRIVAIGGDTIRYAGSPRRLTINGQEVPQPFIRGGRDRFSSSLTEQDCQRLDMRSSEGGCLVPAGRVFVMGDNRGDSEDSRILGPIDEDRIVGRAFVIIWPPGDFSGL
jgi:signal peptidase I